MIRSIVFLLLFVCAPAVVAMDHSETSAGSSSETEIATEKNHFDSVSWLNSKLEVRMSGGIKSVFSKEKLAKNERVAIFGGKVMTRSEVLQLSQELIPYVLQIDDDAWISGLSTSQEVDCINHSCEPNTGIKGQIILVAMRDIERDEEITFDFAMVVSEWIGMFSVACNCGIVACREILSADDWKIERLQEKYKGYFSTYLQERMK